MDKRPISENDRNGSGKYVPSMGRKWFAVDSSGSSPVMTRQTYGPQEIAAMAIDPRPVTSRCTSGWTERLVKVWMMASTTMVSAAMAVNRV